MTYSKVFSSISFSNVFVDSAIKAQLAHRIREDLISISRRGKDGKPKLIGLGRCFFTMRVGSRSTRKMFSLLLFFSLMPFVNSEASLMGLFLLHQMIHHECRSSIIKRIFQLCGFVQRTLPTSSLRSFLICLIEMPTRPVQVVNTKSLETQQIKVIFHYLTFKLIISTMRMTLHPRREERNKSRWNTKLRPSLKLIHLDICIRQVTSHISIEHDCHW